MSSPALLQQQRKRKAAVDQLPSVSITEIKKARIVPLHKGVKNNSPATQVIRNPTMDEISIVPRTIATPTRKIQKTKANSTMEVVNVD